MLQINVLIGSNAPGTIEYQLPAIGNTQLVSLRLPSYLTVAGQPIFLSLSPGTYSIILKNFDNTVWTVPVVVPYSTISQNLSDLVTVPTVNFGTLIKVPIAPVGNYITPSSLAVSLLPYALKSEIPAAPNLSLYALKSEIPATPNLAPYALITQLPNLSGYVTTGVLSSALSPYALSSALTPYVTNSALTSALSPYTLNASLGSAAFTNSSAYATALQGSKADTALQDIANYRGANVPSSPTNGQIWAENDAGGIPINTWIYDAPNTRWLDYVQRDLRIQFTATATATSNSLCVEIPRGASGSILLDHTQMVIWNAVGYTSSIKYALSLNRAPSNSATNTVITNYDLFTLGLTSPGNRVRLPLTTHNILYTETEHFNITATITGAAGFIRISGHVYYRNIR
jgi:hypothetical protein